MAKAKTPSYVLELELLVSSHDRKVLNKKLEVGRQIYNAVLGKAIKCLHRVRSDKEYQNLLKEPSSKERNTRLREIERSYGYSEYDLHEWSAACKHHFEGHLGINEVQKLVTRAFKAVEKLHYHKAEEVHFKRAGETVSIENKTNTTGLRWKEGHILWGEMTISAKVKKNDLYAQRALMDRTKYIRILKREIRGRERFFVQLIQEGYPPQKGRQVGADTVGLDIGPSTVAVVSASLVSLRELAPEASVDSPKIRRIERAMDRSKRATNPENYDANGVPQKSCKWMYSHRYEKLRSQKKNLQHKAAAKRKQSHAILANEILSQGSDIRVETMRFRSLQKRAKKTTYNRKNGKINSKKRFGKSIGNHAPALLLSILDRKLSAVGRRLNTVDTYALKASQFNHVTKEFHKKHLSERWNKIGEHRIQRDLYSAFLIRNTTQELSCIDVYQCEKMWDRFVLLHDQEVRRIKANETKQLKWYVA